MSRVFLKAAALHLRLTAFFDKPHQSNYNVDLRNVYIAASALLTTLNEMPAEQFLYVPRYIEQMMLGAAITIMKIQNSFYANHVDISYGRTLFGRTVNGLRKLSVRSNDLPQRLAEVSAQLWQTSRAGEREGEDGQEPDTTLELKVRCRSSLSVLYDAIWRWRERAGQAGRDNLEHAVENPTNVPADTHGRNTPQPPSMAGGPNPVGLGMGIGMDGPHGDYEMSWDAFGGNAVFDPLSWALDGNLGLGPGLFGANDPLTQPIFQ